MVKLLAAVSTLVMSLMGISLYLYFSTKPPRDDIIIREFSLHHESYGKLKDMLKEDVKIDRLGAWGVQSEGSMIINAPPAAGITTQRFNQYIALLKDVGADGVYRDWSPRAEYCIAVWASGWGAGVRHISICWLDSPIDIPPIQLESHNKSEVSNQGSRASTITRIVENWYLTKD